MKLNIGCGRNILPGFINIDREASIAGVNWILDIERVAEFPCDANSVDYMLMSHILEHIHDPLKLLEKLWFIAKPGCTLEVHVPHGASDAAWEDPQHIRPYFEHSWDYFAQAAYKRADYGYRGDWQCQKIVYILDPELSLYQDVHSRRQLLDTVRHYRNSVLEMRAELIAIKPRRDPFTDYVPPVIEFAEGVLSSSKRSDETVTSSDS